MQLLIVLPGISQYVRTSFNDSGSLLVSISLTQRKAKMTRRYMEYCRIA